MSHSPERKEKDCLNCGTQVHGRFCHVCGQQNVVTHQSFWSLVKHFVYDVLHFDGKFFHTLLYLFTRPGFVARQYVEGKRMSYLDPIRMYLFTSAVFFLVFFSTNTINIGGDAPSGPLSREDRTELAESYRSSLKRRPGDSILKARLAVLQDTTRPVNIDSLGWRTLVTFNKRVYHSQRDYDSVQASLPEDERDGWLGSRLTKQFIKIDEKYGRRQESANGLLNAFLHKLPYLLFFSLPFFALLLKLLYVRRKQFFYSDHSVFTLYHYIFSFILLLLIMGLNALDSLTGWTVFDVLIPIALLAWPVYLYIELRRFYRQGWLKTLGKFLLLNVLALLVMLVLLAAFILFSIFQA